MKIKSLFILFVIFSVYSYGQNITFRPNINHKARHLKQGLNTSGDSLVLASSKQPIHQVDIFNKDFLETIDVDSTKTKIDLNILPAGEFIVQARLGRKRIVMYLRKNKSKVVAYSEQEKNSIQTPNLTPKHKQTGTVKSKQKVVDYYWAVQKTNSSFGSTKTMKLIYKNEVNDLIEKNKLEMKSDIGKDNTLVIYAIYNKNQFMRKQFRNPKYYKSVKKSKHFNIVPYYSTFNEIETVPNS